MGYFSVICFIPLKHVVYSNKGEGVAKLVIVSHPGPRDTNVSRSPWRVAKWFYRHRETKIFRENKIVCETKPSGQTTTNRDIVTSRHYDNRDIHLEEPYIRHEIISLNGLRTLGGELRPRTSNTGRALRSSGPMSPPSQSAGTVMDRGFGCELTHIFVGNLWPYFWHSGSVMMRVSYIHHPLRNNLHGPYTFCLSRWDHYWQHPLRYDLNEPYTSCLSSILS